MGYGPGPGPDATRPSPPTGPLYDAPGGPPFHPPVGGSLDAPVGLGAERNTPTGAVGGKDRPWWGMGDTLLGFLFSLVGAGVGMIVGLPLSRVGLDELTDMLSDGVDFSSDARLLPAIGMSAVGQQLFQGAWPMLVAKWKGFGPVADWRLRFKPSDLWTGFGTGVIGLAAAAVTTLLLTNVTGLSDASAAENTQILEIGEGSPWLWVIVFSVVVGAPISEELFFRGLTLRAIEKRAGTAAAVVLSSLVFALPHFIGGGLQASIVLLGTIFVIGLILAIVTIVTDRLAPAIIAHMVFNGYAAVALLSGWAGGA